MLPDNPARAALAEEAARGVPVLPRLRLLYTAEALAAPVPQQALDLNEELEALCAALRESVLCRTGWLYFAPAADTVPLAVPRSLLQAAVLCWIEGVMTAPERRAVLHLETTAHAAVLVLRGGTGRSLPADTRALLLRLAGAESPSTSLPSGGMELLLQFLVLCVLPAIGEELLFRGALQGLLRPCGSSVAIFGPALLFALLHLDPIQGLTAFVCAIFLGWLAERSGSILPGMLLHFVNNCLAFLNLYLRLYADNSVSFALELFVLLFFPLFGGWLLLHARQQGFRFSVGLRPGVDVLTVFTSPAYTLTVLFLFLYPFVITL